MRRPVAPCAGPLRRLAAAAILAAAAALPATADTVLEAVYPARSGGGSEICGPTVETAFTVAGAGPVTIRVEWTSPWWFHRRRWARYSEFLFWNCEGRGCEGYSGYAPNLQGLVCSTRDPDPHVPNLPAVIEWVFEHTRTEPATLSTAIAPVCDCRWIGDTERCVQTAEQFRVTVDAGAGVVLTLDRPGSYLPEPVPPDPAEIVAAATVANGATVRNGPTAVTTFTLDRALYLARITTYHWNGGRGAPAGTITLVAPDGSLLGPWQAEGRPGSGAQNVNWVAEPGILLQPGTYGVIDSDPATWSQNAGSGGRGFVWVEGVWR